MRTLFFTLLILTTTAFSTPARPLSITHAATGKPVLAFGSVAIARGSGFTDAPATYGFAGTLPTTLGEVTVTIDGTQAGIRYASPEEVVFIVPVLRNVGWHLVTIRSGSGRESRAWVYIVRTALGIFQQNGYPQGEVQNGRGTIPCVIGSAGCVIQNTGETRLRLLGTGFLYAPHVWAVLVDANGREYWIDVREDAHEQRAWIIGSFLDFAGLDFIAFKLPDELRGAAWLMFYAPGDRQHWPSLSNAVPLVIE